MKIFWDSEFTGLHRKTTLISLGLVTETDQTFYAEFTDYDEDQLDRWLRDNVLAHLKFGLDRETGHTEPITNKEFNMKGNWHLVKEYLRHWLGQFSEVEFWSDCLSYDWMLLNELLADWQKGYPQLPTNVLYHSPYDIVTLFKMNGLDPDIRRTEFVGWPQYEESNHNALWDARVIKACYEKLVAHVK